MKAKYDDQILIKDLEVFAKHGVHQEEKKLGQKFLVSVKIFLNLEDINDDIAKTVSYSQICKKIVVWMEENCFNLIETCAEFVAKNLLLQYDKISAVEVEIKKPWAPILKSIDYASVNVKKEWHFVYIGVGSNLGDRKENIDGALKLLEEKNIKVLQCSQIIETKPLSDIPFNEVPQNNYLNCAVYLKTFLSPNALMKTLLAIEKELGRVRDTDKWGAPRTMDLDVLFYDDEIINNKMVIVPHPKMQERPFVLEPMVDLSPHLLHPVFKKSMLQLKEELEVKSPPAMNVLKEVT